MTDAARCLQVDVDPDEVDLVSGLLWAGGATGIQELEIVPGRARLVATIPAQVEARLVADLSDRWHPDAFDAEYDGWLDAWRPFARPVRAGHVVVYPPWEPPPWTDLPTKSRDVLIPIDPGRAFGQGSHATTRLMLLAIEKRFGAGTPTAVLDVGCGSGVLSVVAAVLGCRHVIAVDIDEEAVRATRQNAVDNLMGDRIDMSSRPVDEVAGGFDLVVANILAPVLIELAPAIAARVAPGGLLFLSGLQHNQRTDVLDAYRSAAPHLHLEREASDGDWLQLTLKGSP